MPAYFKATLTEFISLTATNVVGELTISNSKEPTRFKLPPEVIDAWRLQLEPLQLGIAEFLKAVPLAAKDFILLEYPIPMVGRRIDAVILLGNIVVVVETKTGSSPSSAVRQVEDYAINLACFHEFCTQRVIVPVVLSNSTAVGNAGGTTFDDLIAKTIIASRTNFCYSLTQIYKAYYHPSERAIDVEDFNRGRFKPIPRIIDAAVSLYYDMDVFEIGHACAADDSLHRTKAALIGVVSRARRSREKVICFVTGVPGAGKTLVGLNMVHDPEIREVGSFLSGNGPLVKIMQEALVRDIVERSRLSPQRVTRGDAEIRVKAFIHNVHRFIDEHRTTRPTRNVVVFDEAQRAWDKTENERAGRRGSEPETMLEIMDRHNDWAVVVALVGGGQEINRGEAGLAEWGRALQSYQGWQVFASPHVLRGGDAVAGFRLFEAEDINPDRIHEDAELHLTIATRSIRAKQISRWVNAVLEGKGAEARAAAKEMQAKPLVCRDLKQLRSWLMGARRGSTRSGLVGSAYAARLRADGVEISFDFHKGFEWEHWFLDAWECEKTDCTHRYCHDVRASSTLEVAATQFEIQGLELDWVGVCWGEDLVRTNSQWQSMKFNNKTWQPQKDARKAEYVRNGYRVLLTRARQQMAIYVPKIDAAQNTRLGAALEETAEWLLNCGAKELLFAQSKGAD